MGGRVYIRICNCIEKSLEYTPPQKFCSWSSLLTKLSGLPTSRREELPLQREGHNIHDDFAVAIPRNNNVVPRKSLQQESGSAARWFTLDIPEDAHQGGVKTNQTTLCRNFGGKKGGGHISEGSVLVGDYGTSHYPQEDTPPMSFTMDTNSIF